jgi:predicted 3-demethylubiquinone-9 3-methyltransferase (glyoxalase superfamily)
VEFTVLGIPCLGLNGGPEFKHSEAFSFQIATDNQQETDRYWNAIVGNGGQESAVRVVQGSLGPLLADHPACAYRCARGWRR